MANAYFFNNETKNEQTYVRNTGSYMLEVPNLVERICNEKKWDAKDKVIIMFMNAENLVTYIYQNGKFDIKASNNIIEIESYEEDMYSDNDIEYGNQYDESDYDDYYDEEIYDDRFDDDRYDDDYDNGYEDEFYECCDIY